MAVYVRLSPREKGLIMGAIGPWQIAIVLVLILLLFGGGGRISSMMGDLAKGLKAFRTGLKDDEKSEKSLDERVDEAVDVTPEKEKEKTAE